MAWLLSLGYLALAAALTGADLLHNSTDLGGGLSPTLFVHWNETVVMAVSFPPVLPDGQAIIAFRGFGQSRRQAKVSVVANTMHVHAFSLTSIFQAHAQTSYHYGFMSFAVRNAQLADSGWYLCRYKPNTENVLYTFTNCGQQLIVLPPRLL